MQGWSGHVKTTKTAGQKVQDKERQDGTRKCIIQSKNGNWRVRQEKTV